VGDLHSNSHKTVSQVHFAIINLGRMEHYPTDRAALERDCDLDFFIASGPGGQNRNKVETGVRLVHRPTHITVTATERRSQYANREAAFARMALRLQERQRPVTPRKKTRPTAGGRERRLNTKRYHSLRKQLRMAPVSE
jgi:ribosome-associated protein